MHESLPRSILFPREAKTFFDSAPAPASSGPRHNNLEKEKLYIHCYAETGAGRVKPLSGEFEGLLRLRVGNYRVFFDETEDTITVHRVRDRKKAHRD